MPDRRLVEGIAADLGSRLDHAVSRGELPGLHAFLAVRQAKLAVFDDDWA